jgi:hypothetical protein
MSGAREYAEERTREDLIRALLATYPPQARSQAVLDVAHDAGVAVHWEDRTTFEASLCIEFTDAEWVTVRDEIGVYDEVMSTTYGVSDAVRDWMEQCIRDAGLSIEALEARWLATHGDLLPRREVCGG